jgi:hypothetical protein
MSALKFLALLSVAAFVTAESAEPVSDSPEVTQLEEFFESGLDRRRTSRREIEEGYRDLKRRLSDSMISDYAYALVLLKRNQFDEAIEVLNELREQSAPAYASAWQASIWNLLTRRRYEDGYEQLVEFAKLTADAGQQWSQLGQAEANARWMGKLVEGLGYQFTSGTRAKQLQDARAKVEAALPAPLKKEFLAGGEEVRVFRRHLEGGATATKLQAQRQQAKADEQSAKELKEKEEEALDTKDKLKLTAEEWKKKLDKELIDFGRKIGSLQRDYAFLEARRASLERSITLVQREKTALDLANQQQQNRNQNQKGGLFNNARNNQYIAENARLFQKYNEYQAQLKQTLAAMQQTAAQGTQLLAQRQALINEYQQATGELVKQDKQLEKLAEKLSKQQEEIAAGETKRDPAELKQLRKRMRYFSTYVDFDYEKEKQKLIDAVRASHSQGD